MRNFQSPGRSLAYSTNAMAATSHPLATHTALELLKAGGNAVDAAIGAAVLLGTAEPQMTGIGGDCFVLIQPAGSDNVIAVNGSGRGPAGLNAATLRDEGLTGMPPASAHSVTLPGAVDAFCRLADEYGKLGIDRILQPAIKYTEEGIPVAPRVALDWIKDEPRLSGAARSYFLDKDKPYSAGKIFRHPKLAEVLRKIASQGRDGFYSGEVADDMVASLQNAGGSHTLEDFSSVETEYTTPISGLVNGYDLIEHPPNGQGAAAILLTNILSHFDIAKMDPFGVERTHIEAEASKLAYDARDRFLADADYMTRLDHMLSADTAEKLAGLINPSKAMVSASTTSETVHKDTIYLTVVDKDQNIVSLIYSIYNGFGSGIASEKFGVLMHNRGAGFTLEEGHPNEAGPGKRPKHTIIPAMLAKAGKVVMPFGVMGGAYQANGHARFLSNVLDFGMDIQTAIDSPRSFPDQGKLTIETGYSDDVVQKLADMGHQIEICTGPIGGAQAIWIDHENGVLKGASDPRKDGIAQGY